MVCESVALICTLTPPSLAFASVCVTLITDVELVSVSESLAPVPPWNSTSKPRSVETSTLRLSLPPWPLTMTFPPVPSMDAGTETVLLSFERIAPGMAVPIFSWASLMTRF